MADLKELILRNPGLPVKIFCETNDDSDGSGWWEASTDDAEIGEVMEEATPFSDRTYFNRDEFMKDLSRYVERKKAEYPDEWEASTHDFLNKRVWTLEEMVEREAEEYPWTKAIIVKACKYC